MAGWELVLGADHPDVWAMRASLEAARQETDQTDATVRLVLPAGPPPAAAQQPAEEQPAEQELAEEPPPSPMESSAAPPPDDAFPEPSPESPVALADEEKPPAEPAEEEPPAAAAAAETGDPSPPESAPVPGPELEPPAPHAISQPALLAEEPPVAVVTAEPPAPERLAAEPLSTAAPLPAAPWWRLRKRAIKRRPEPVSVPELEPEPQAPQDASEPAPLAEEPPAAQAVVEPSVAPADGEEPAAAGTEAVDQASPEPVPAPEPEPEPEPREPQDVAEPAALAEEPLAAATGKRRPPPTSRRMLRLPRSPPRRRPSSSHPPLRPMGRRPQQRRTEAVDQASPEPVPAPEPEPEPAPESEPQDVAEPAPPPEKPPAPSVEEPAAKPPDASLAKARHRRRVLGLAAAVVIALAAGGVAGFLTRPHAGHSGHGAASRSAGSQPLSAASQLAAVWVAQQIASSTIVACDPLMCSALEAQGVPAANLLVLRADATSPLGAQVVVVTPAVRDQFGSRMDSVYAPSVIAGFGSGAGQVSVQVVAQNGPTPYLTALRQDAADRKAAGAQLLANKHIQASAGAQAQLAAGTVDARLLIMLPALAAVHPIQILAFGDPAPGAGPDVPLCSAELSGSGRAANMSDVNYLRWLTSFVGTQLVPFAGNMSVLAEAGQPVVRVVFAQPSPLGLLSHT